MDALKDNSTPLENIKISQEKKEDVRISNQFNETPNLGLDKNKPVSITNKNPMNIQSQDSKADAFDSKDAYGNLNPQPSLNNSKNTQISSKDFIFKSKNNLGDTKPENVLSMGSSINNNDVVRSSITSKPNFGASKDSSRPHINALPPRTNNDSMVTNPLTEIDGNASTTINKTVAASKPLIGIAKKDSMKPKKDYSQLNNITAKSKSTNNNTINS